MGLTGMLAILLVGELITRTNIPLGYQIAMGFAFILGLVSTFSFSHLRDPRSSFAPGRTAGSFSPRTILRELKAHPYFLALGLVMAFWNFSLNIAGPFF